MNQELSANTQLSHYRIVSKIGAGGMGEVWLAEDSRLDRQVALKLLPSEFVSNQDRLRRFVQEAKAAAALNHPHIAHVYEVGEANGTQYIAMEFVDGDTLSVTIRRDACAPGVLLKYLSQVAEGLAKAHAAGIVHRDLKPDNIMITRDGYAKILDFGLAKLIEPRSSSIASEDAVTAMMPAQPLSAAGAVMGTVGYMSPEQAQGKPVDQRSDIFSFGCILYESAAGRRPFEGDSAIDTLHKIIYEAAPPVTDFNPNAPADLQRIIRRCLAKDPEKRYQTIRDAANDLDDLRREIDLDPEASRTMAPKDKSTTGASASQASSSQREAGVIDGHAPSPSSAEYLVSQIGNHKQGVATGLLILLALIAAGVWFFFNRSSEPADAIRSLAVMPFVNESGNADLDYLSDGMTETLIGRLSQLPNLSVKARSSVFRYKGKELDLPKIAQELKVQAILTGRVVQRGEQVTFSLELVDAQTENVIWSEQYNRKQADLLSLQSEVARDVSSKLKTKLSGAESAKVEKKYTTNNEAYQLYLKGRYFGRQFTLDGFHKSVEAYQQAIALDPNYALAYAGLSDAYFYASTIHLPPLEALPKAKEYALRALEHDDALAAAHHSIANVKINYERDYAGAAREFERAIDLDPSEPFTYHDYAWLFATRCEFERAIAMAERAQQIDPLAEQFAAFLGGVYMMAGQYDKALEQLQATLRRDDRNWWAHYWQGVTYNQKGMFDRAIESLQMAAKLDNAPMIRGALAHVLARADRSAEARRIMDELMEESKTRYVAPSALVVAYSGLGDREKAFAWLEKTYESHDEGILFIKDHPMFTLLRDDPRYKGMLKRVNLPE